MDRQEGDVEVAGVVLRGEGIAWAQGRQVDAELVIYNVRCKAVILGSPSTLQLVGLGQAQLKPLAEAPRVFALTKGGDKFVPARVVSEGNRAAKLLDEDDRTLSRVAAVRFQINGKPALPLLQVAEPLAAEALAEKKKQLPKGASLQLHGIACRVLGPGFVQVKQVQKMLRFLRGMTPFPELKAVQVGPVQRFDAECRNLVPVNAKELQLRLEDRVTAAEEPAAEAAAEPEAADEPAAPEDIAEEPDEADEPAAAEDIAAEEPAAEAAAEDIAEEPEEPEEAGSLAVLPVLAPLRVFGEKGFDVHMRGGPYARVLGDLYHAGQILEKLDFEVQLQLYKDSRKKGSPQVFNVVPKMVEDRRSGKAFDVEGVIARVTRVTMLMPAPTELNGFWGYWLEGRREIVSNFDKLLKADPAPYGPETLFNVDGDLLCFQGYDPSTQTVRCEEDIDLPLSQVHAIVADM